MSNIILGLFENTNKAAEAVNELKEKGFSKEISILAHDKNYENAEIKEIKQDVSTGTAVGATVGAVAGVLAALFSGITSILIPGIGILVGGPLVAALGLTGGVTGSLGGGLVGGLIDLGINEASAELYEREIKQGQILIGVTADDKTEGEVLAILHTYDAHEVSVVETSK